MVAAMEAVMRKRVSHDPPSGPVVTPGQSTQPRYPVFWITLDELDYLFAAPEFNDRKSGEPYLLMYDRWERLLSTGGHEESDRFVNLRRVFRKLVSPEATWDPPLGIAQSRDFRYYVVRGNRRLCCLRAFASLGWLHDLSWLGRGAEGEALVACRLLHPEDKWADDTRMAFVHPWEQWA